jgi:hypothetical protein
MKTFLGKMVPALAELERISLLPPWSRSAAAAVWVVCEKWVNTQTSSVTWGRETSMNYPCQSHRSGDLRFSCRRISRLIHDSSLLKKCTCREESIGGRVLRENELGAVKGEFDLTAKRIRARLRVAIPVRKKTVRKHSWVLGG